MDLILLAELAIIFALGTYVQTITGFGLGMIIMGAVTMFDLLPIAFTSVVISLMTFFNGTFAIKGNSKALDKRLVMLTAGGLIPGVAIGLYILHFLSTEMNNLLQLLLGAAIIIGASTTLLKPEPRKTVSSSWTFVFAGKVAGNSSNAESINEGMNLMTKYEVSIQGIEDSGLITVDQPTNTRIWSDGWV